MARRKKKKKATETKTLSVKSWKWKNDLLALLGLGSYSVAIWWPTRNLLYWGEMQNWLVVAINELAARGFKPWALVEWDTALPPGFATLISMIKLGVGDLNLASHGLMLVAVILYLGGTYLVISQLKNRYEALLVSFLVGLSPILVAATGWVSIYLWSSGLWMVGIWLWERGKKIWAVSLFSAGSLCLPSSLIYLVYVWWRLRKNKSGKVLGQKMLLVPVLVYVMYLMYHQVSLGWWLIPPGGMLVRPENAGVFVKYMVFVSQVILGWHMRWLLSGLGLASMGLLYLKGKGQELWKEYDSVVLLFVVYLAFWSFKGGFEEEMAIMVLPWVILLMVGVIKQGMRVFLGEDVDWYLLIVVGIVAVAWLTQWRPNLEAEKGFELRQPTDLSYQDRIYVSTQMASYLEFLHSDAKVYGGVPESAQLTLPELGYVNKTLDFSWCRDFSLDPGTKQLIVFHPYHQSQVDCKDVLEKSTSELLQRYESHGRWVEIYRITSRSDE